MSKNREALKKEAAYATAIKKLNLAVSRGRQFGGPGTNLSLEQLGSELRIGREELEMIIRRKGLGVVVGGRLVRNSVEVVQDYGSATEWQRMPGQNRPKGRCLNADGEDYWGEDD